MHCFLLARFWDYGFFSRIVGFLFLFDFILQEENEEEEEEEKEGNEAVGNNVAHTSDRKRLLWWRARQKTEERNVRDQRLTH